MSVNASLTKLAKVLGVAPKSKTTTGLLNEISKKLGGADDAATVSQAIDNIAEAKSGKRPSSPAFTEEDE